MFGASPWTFDHKGVRFIGLDTVSRAPDFWTSRKMSPKERMGNMATLDGTLGGAWAAVGANSCEWLNTTLSSWGKDKPVVIFTHNPLYEYYPPWNFWVRDWREVQEILKPYSQGHQHPRPHPPGALQRDRQDALDRHARHLLAVALRARGRAGADQGR